MARDFSVKPFGFLYSSIHCLYQALTVMDPDTISSPLLTADSFSASLVMASSSVFPVASYFFPLYRAVFRMYSPIDNASYSF